MTVEGNICAEQSACVKVLLSVVKGSGTYYNTIMSDDVKPNCCTKWDQKFNAQNDWKRCFWYMHKIQDVQLKWFQMRIVHRCLGTNVVLKQMGIVNNDRCNFCLTEKDNIEHIFWACAHVQQFWNCLASHMNEKCLNSKKITLTKKLVILGFDKNFKVDLVFCFIILLAKQFLYQCKRENVLPTLQSYLCKLKYRYRIEECNANINMLYSEFAAKWCMYKPLILTIA